MDAIWDSHYEQFSRFVPFQLSLQYTIGALRRQGGGVGGRAMDSMLTSTDDVSKSGPWLKVKTHCRCHCPWSWTRSNSSFPWKWMIIGALMECWLLALGQRHSSLLVLMHCIGMCISHTTTYSQCVQLACCVAGDFCQYWNLNSQNTLEFDILIIVSKAKFKKKLNDQTRFN